MLDMLHPRSDLGLIVMENVAEEDRLLAGTPETFVGVDLTEYYGGTNSSTAKSIVIVQVKYSPTNPNANWTLNRLCTDKISSKGMRRPGTSILRKLADPFAVFYQAVGDATSETLQVKLHTNQPLSRDLRVHLLQAQSLVSGKSDQDGSRILRQTIGDLRDILDQLQQTTKLSWKRLAAFLKCWDLSSFGQAMLSDTEAELFTLMNQYVSDSGVHFGGLFSFVQEHAVSNRPTEITPKQVLAQLRLRKTDLFPAPSHFPPIQGLQYTEAAESVMQAIDGLEKGMLLVHGVSGTGKSTVLRLVAEHYGGGNSTVIYDCYAGGAGLQPGSERFPYTKCFVQITNELEKLFHTNTLATTELRYEHLMYQFREALARAATTARNRGHRLVIAIDAIDNAVDATNRSPIRDSGSFVPLLWNTPWPDNCVIIISARTENLTSLGIDCKYQEIKAEGFTAIETARYIRSFWSDADDDLVEYIHNRTNGNPRVQSKLIDDADREKPSDLIAFVDGKARETAFRYYEQECPKRLGTQKDTLLLAILFESTQFISIETLAQITQRLAEEVRLILESLYFGLRISETNEILWRDQDFLDFSRLYIKDVIDQAQHRLADYCQKNYEQTEYAKRNLSRHLFSAGRYEELLDWWLERDRLVKRISEAEPHEEDVLSDIQYALLAATAIDQVDAALRILSLAADILQGRDVFCAEIKSRPSIAIECGYLDRLLEFLRTHETDEHLAGDCFAIARALAEHQVRLDLAQDLAQRGIAIIRQETRRHPGRQGGFSIDNVRDIGLFEANAFGLDVALENMTRWKPQETIYPVYTTLTQLWSPQRGQVALDAIECVDLDDYQRAHAILGVLGAVNCQLGAEAFESSATATALYIEDGIFDQTKIQNTVYRAVENALSQGLTEVAKRLIAYSRIPKPDHHIVSNTITFLKLKAIQTVLKIQEFSPDDFELDPLPAHIENPQRYRSEREQRVRQIRSRMRRLFPSLLCRAKALIGRPSLEIIEEIRICLDPWLRDVEHQWHKPQYDFVDVASHLLEAATMLRNFQRGIVQEILDAADQVMPSSSDQGYIRYADILSQDPRYFGQAERLTRDRQRVLHPPTYRASEIVQELLSMYPIAARFDRELAYALFSDARLAANEWDGNIDGRAFALLRTASHIQNAVEIPERQLAQLATVFEYMKRIAFDEANPRLDEALRLISRIQPSFALDVLRRLERANHLTFSDGVGSVALGMLDARLLPPGLLWPLVHIVDSSEKGLEIAYQSISQQLDTGDMVSQSLQALAQYIRVNVSRQQREAKAAEFVAWASEKGLGDDPTPQSMQKFVARLNELGLNRADEHQLAYDISREGTALFESFSQCMVNSPQLALVTLEKASLGDIKSLREDEIKQIVDNLAQSLPSAQTSRLFPIIERWGQDRAVPAPFRLVIKIASQMRPSAKAKDAVIKSFQTLLTPRAIHRLTREYYQEYLDELLACKLLDTGSLFSLVLSATASSLRELEADDLYRLVGYLGELLPSHEARRVFDTLLQRAVDKLPYELDWKFGQDADSNAALIRFLSDYLGHPRQAIRWRVLYTLIDMTLNVPDPTLSLLVSELSDQTHERWMTKREWILFALHHLSLRELPALRSHAQSLLSQALSKEFPHAKMRYHAKEALLNIERTNPGVLSPDVTAEVREVNAPKELITRENVENRRAVYEGTLWRERRDVEFRFDLTDTLPYWFSPLSHCFAQHRCHVADIAYKWIVKEWGITEAKYREERERHQAMYSRWEDTGHRHGSAPAVETLKLYAERHSMFMAAGELIDSAPVVFIGEREGDRWHDWMRYRLRAADPALPGRLVDAPPALADNYGIFPTDYEEWVKKECEQEFKNELHVRGKPDWMIVASSRGGTFQGRQLGASVMSALVNSKTAPALLRLVSLESEHVPLPYIDASYDTILPEFEQDLQNRGDYYVYPQNEIHDDSGLFELRSWLVYWHQEMPFHSFDPKWPEFGRDFYFPGADFCSRLGLHREPISMVWSNNEKETIACYETWYDQDGTSEYTDYATGHRLVVRKDALCHYLREVGLDMIFIVTLSRQRPHWYRRGGDGEYDLGTNRAYVLTAEGELQ
jgi:hypothetical protein